MPSHSCPISELCLNRRKFLAAGGAGALAYALPLPSSMLLAETNEEPGVGLPKLNYPRARVGLIFSHIPPNKPTWPYVNYDYESRKKELTTKLREACPNTDFEVATATNEQEAGALVQKMEDADGFIAYPVGVGGHASKIVVHSGKPVVLVDDLYGGSGEFITVYAAAVRENLPVVGVSSSDFNDVGRGARLFEVIKCVQNSKILDVANRDLTESAALMKSFAGITVQGITSEELESLYQKADEQMAARWADKWIKGAKKIVEPSREDIVKSGKIHLALMALMQEHGAEAVTIDCLGLVYGGKLSAYPCLSFWQLNNSGFVGACEADLNSTATLVVMRHLIRRPGYISDPVFDFAKGQIIYAHCVAPTKVYGTGGKTNPYVLRSHAEDNKGAVVQSLLPLGETVTTLEANMREKALVMHTARTVANIDDPKACRTKLAAEANVEKILRQWRWGWHRVTFYGDWRKDVKNLATLMNWTLYEDDV